MENRIFLLNLLQLTSNIMENNNEAIKIVEEFNKVELTKDQQGQLKENIFLLINKSMKNINLLKEVVSNIKILNKEYLLSLIELKNIDFSNISLLKSIVSKNLSNQTIVFDDNIDKYMYYSLLVNLTIASRDIDLIKLAIDKIQSI